MGKSRGLCARSELVHGKKIPLAVGSIVNESVMPQNLLFSVSPVFMFVPESAPLCFFFFLLCDICT